jgi:hypothetical protein
MKIISQILQALVLTATSVATSVVLFSSSPAQAVNLIKNGNYGGAVDFPWEGNAYPNPDGGGFGTIFQTLSESTDPLRKYKISFTIEDPAYQFSAINSLRVDLGDINKGGQNLLYVDGFGSSPDIEKQYFAPYNLFISKIFDGNGAKDIYFNYQLNTPYQLFFLSGLAVDDLSPPKDPTSPTPSVPEPLTIVGTIIGGTAAFRLKKRLESSKK